MEGGVLGATDLTVCHDDLGVQGQPLSRAVLDMGEGVTGVRILGEARWVRDLLT